MGNLSTELRRVSKRLEAVVLHARGALASGVTLDPAHCNHLRELTTKYDQLVILNGGAPGASKLMTSAVALLERCDPLANLRSIKIEYIDRLVSTCDSLMSAGVMPDDAYLVALGHAVHEFEMIACDDDASLLAFAWDVLAQAEAGLGEATCDAHYEQAEARYHRPRRSSPPALALVSSN